MRSGRAWPLPTALLVTLLGAGASAAAGAALHQAQHRTSAQAMDQRAVLTRLTVQAETRRYADTLAATAAAAGALDELTADAFAQITASLPELSLPGATSITFLVAATDIQIPRVQARWRTRGVPDLTLRTDGRGHGREHTFVIFNRPLQPGAQPAPGLEAGQVPELDRALQEARYTQHVTVSDTYHLLIDRHLPPERRQRSLVMVAPVHEPAGEGGAFIGWVAMGLRGQDFAAAALRHIAADRIDVLLSARQSDGRLVPVAAITAAGAQHPPHDLHRTAAIQVGQRSWQLRIAASSGALPGATSALPALAAAGGSALSLLLGALVFTLASGRAGARAQVEQATTALRAEHAALRSARDELAAHEAYLTQVLDTIEVTVVTCDAEGTIVHLNEVARAALPSFPPRTATELARHLPLLRTDATPLPVEQSPLMRALDGHDVDNLEAAVLLPDGTRRILMLHARPLRHTGGRLIGAVVSSYDITELREHQAELQAFAGIVAHDLKRPLSTVAGFAELARDDLDGPLERRPEHDPVAALAAGQARYLDRILAGVAQMNHLIEDLLAYAAARNAELQPRRIDLNGLVGEIVGEHLAAVAADPAAPPPQVRIDPLPEVYADATLVRRLVDNLVGNAIKYTPPGQAARVEVTTWAAAEGRVGIQVADRGIGIPPDEHQAIFTSFHRAAEAAETYSGTGLGLAICQRIVQRHGGTITAADNPGGGARFTFTLPAVPATPE
ncbi:hypothetical protein Psi01_66000 [Planobispora siamensis]|uniref:Sensor-like histidine kinase SenX3 n=1 Tax=Planobispora siamensis TaxID=936338 RepID=A0A8J3SMK4_9ACTN|nr:hypothetical protein Psi01_66000 [Planobispora siamensis]